MKINQIELEAQEVILGQKVEYIIMTFKYDHNESRSVNLLTLPTGGFAQRFPRSLRKYRIFEGLSCPLEKAGPQCEICMKFLILKFHLFFPMGHKNVQYVRGNSFINFEIGALSRFAPECKFVKNIFNAFRTSD